ncbi:MAG: hypothetical protein LBT40_17440 [Deltaproteobacteria bacterium]|jgi:hypothetical protein|nr:hypothetical protein [Deltaproteobacteria bacterium]
MLVTIVNAAPILASLFCQLLLSLSAFAESSGFGAIISFLAGKAVLAAARMAVAAVFLLTLSSNGLIANDSRNGDSGFVRTNLTMEQIVIEVDNLFPGNTPFTTDIKNRLATIRSMGQDNGRSACGFFGPSGRTLADTVYEHENFYLKKEGFDPALGIIISKPELKELADFIVGEGYRPSYYIFSLLTDKMHVMQALADGIWHTSNELNRLQRNLSLYLRIFRNMPASYDSRTFIGYIEFIKENYLFSVDLKLSYDGISYVESEAINNKMLDGLSRLMRFNVSQRLLANFMKFTICTSLEEGEEISRYDLMRDIKFQIIRLFETYKGEFENFSETQLDLNSLPPEICVALISFERIAD